jgi:hypothetical protein
MSMIQPGLFALFERFPDHKSALKDQYLQSESFQTLCSDYERCAKAIKYWKLARSEEASQRSTEYRELLAELEEEVRQMLRGI